ncbi:thiamine phosphate synthase [Pontibacter diazotrophicus]|uniref:Thiamine-phosphate synthase n=1 Tax=Pontibacter diazotrophicus TaxID=1400979 RepID=A0A3D8LHW1_9BACT|nr:thiamine phosphate synthase [Pontibacter diazotrophicus]RDV16985.1 thiamine phosphate synthase [Pontibacter diazotrophicus]
MISRLHYITQETAAFTHAMAAEAACMAGADWVQLRVKTQPYEVWKELALQTKSICRCYGCTFIINDNVALAAEVDADGVHLGQLDMSPREARELLGSEKIIGCTANTFADVQRLVEQGVDYIGLGPYRFTSTKSNLSPILGLEGYTDLLQQCRQAGISIPIIAIGGITAADMPLLLQTGIHGIAVSSAITLAPDRAAAMAEFNQHFSLSTEKQV